MRLLLVPLAVVALLALAPAARAADRLDALVMQLRERPLAIDPELSWFLDRAEEARLRRVLKDSPVPFHVALVPQLEDDESGGQGDRIAVTLHRRLGRPGIYLVIDQRGYFEARAYAVPRRVEVTYLDGPPVGDKLTADAIVDRVDLLVRQVATAPAGQTTDDLPLRRLRGYKEPYAPASGPAGTAEVAAWTAVVFGVLGGIGGSVARLSARRQQRLDEAAHVERERAARAAAAAAAAAAEAERQRRQAAKPFWKRFFR